MEFTAAASFQLPNKPHQSTQHSKIKEEKFYAYKLPSMTPCKLYMTSKKAVHSTGWIGNIINQLHTQ